MRNYIPHVFIVILLIAVVFQCTDQISLAEQVATEKQKAVGLEKEIKAKDRIVLELNSQKDSLNLLIGTLNNKIEAGKNNIQTIKKQKDENINIINNLSNDDLQLFFSEYYPDK